VWRSEADLVATERSGTAIVTIGSETSAVAALRACTKAVILAAGRGTRMQAVDRDTALTTEQGALADAGLKAMMPIIVQRSGEEDTVEAHPFLDYSLSALGDAGFTDVCIVVAPDDHMIRNRYRRTAIPTRFRVSFATQFEAAGTGDAVLAAEEFTAGEPFVVINSDNYYPADVLATLRAAKEPACVGFSREGLIRRGDVAAERIAAYAILDVGADGNLRGIIEKPDPAYVLSHGSKAQVSMNCWRLTSEIFRACRDVPPSPRGEIELPAAVQYAIDVLGVRVRVIQADAPVLDLSRRADIPIVAERLRGVALKL
jgi:dTDP-glucose pyrophosphorylase